MPTGGFADYSLTEHDRQWRRQVLLRGGAKLEIRSWGIYGGLLGRVQQRLDDWRNSFVTSDGKN